MLFYFVNTLNEKIYKYSPLSCKRCMCVCMHVCVCVCMCVCAYVSAYVCLCVVL